MSFIVKNLFRSATVHWKTNLVILFDLFLSMAVIFILLQNYYFLKEKHDEFYETDRVATVYSVYMKIDDYQVIKTDTINESSMFHNGLDMYNEINSTSLKIFNYAGSSLLLDNFDDSSKMLFEKYKTVENDISYVDTCGFTEYAMSSLGLKTDIGREFTEEEYENFAFLEKMPVILGAELKQVFDIGDEFEYTLDGITDKAVVIGFLESGSDIYLTDYRTGLDRAIIFPTTQLFPRQNRYRNEGFLDRSKISHLNDCFIYSPDNDVDVQSAVNRYTAKYAFPGLEVSPLNGTGYSESKNISEKNMILIGILALIVTLLCLISLIGILYNRALKDRNANLIFMCYGVSLWKINASLITEMVFWLFISVCPVIALSVKEYGKMMIPLWQLFLFGIIVTGVSLVPTLVVNGRSNLDQLIRDKIE